MNLNESDVLKRGAIFYGGIIRYMYRRSMMLQEIVLNDISTNQITRFQALWGSFIIQKDFSFLHYSERVKASLDRRLPEEQTEKGKKYWVHRALPICRIVNFSYGYISDQKYKKHLWNRMRRPRTWYK